MSGLADKHNYGIDTYLNNMLASRMEPLKNMPGYIDIRLSGACLGTTTDSTG